MILFVMVTGTMPFDEPSLAKTFERIQDADYSSPPYLSSIIVDLIAKILVPNPENRISISDIKKHPWYKHTYDEVSGAHACEEEMTITISSEYELQNIVKAIMIALKELAFAAIASGDEIIKVKGYKKSRKGMIGLTVNVSRSSNGFLVSIHRGRGELFEYSEDLKWLSAKLNAAFR